jgi:hypothetical protein
MEVSGQLYVPAALPTGERDSGTHWIGGWVGPRTGLDVVVKKNHGIIIVNECFENVAKFKSIAKKV